MVCVVTAGSGAPWEAFALGQLQQTNDIVVLKRCVDVDDVMASATTGQIDVAVVGVDLAGLDAAAVDYLRRHDVRLVAVAAGGGPELDQDRARAQRLGIREVVARAELERLDDVVRQPRTLVPPARPRAEAIMGRDTDDTADESAAGGPAAGQLVAVWGASGAGRTTAAVAVATELAARQHETVAIDADPYGGTVAQHLGILDETSGILAASRLATAGQLEENFASVQRRVGERLRVVTGLPRPDRWRELRGGTVDALLDVARGTGQVIVDTGFSLEEDHADLSGRGGRNSATRSVLESADQVLVLGTADPVGLARLVAALGEFHDAVPGLTPHVVVNRMRPTLSWSVDEVSAFLTDATGLPGANAMFAIPDDVAALDRAMLAGRTPRELGTSPFTQAIGHIVDRLFPGSMTRTAETGPHQ